MAENKLSTSLSGVKRTFNLLREWEESEDAEKSFFHQANSILRDNSDEIRQMKRQSAQDNGTNRAKASASGIDVSSFNDALLSEDLKHKRERYEKRKQAEEKAEILRKRARNEMENRQKKAFSYSVGLLSDISGLGF